MKIRFVFSLVVLFFILLFFTSCGSSFNAKNDPHGVLYEDLIVKHNNEPISNGNTLGLGHVMLGSQGTPHAIDISNGGTSDLVVTGVSLTGTDSADFVLNGAPSLSALIPAGGVENISFDVSFAPSGQAGLKTATLAIQSTDPNKQMFLIYLTGMATDTDQPQMIVNYNNTVLSNNQTLNMGDVVLETSSVYVDFDLFNVGSSILEVTSVMLTGTGYGPALPFPAFTIGANESYGFGFPLYMDAPTGPRTATVTINSNDPSHPAFVIVLEMNVIDPSEAVSLVVTSGGEVIDDGTGLYTFAGTVPGSSTATTFMIENRGSVSVTVDDIAVANESTAIFSLDEKPSLSFTLAPGETAEFEIGYNPTSTDLVGATVSLDYTVSGGTPELYTFRVEGGQAQEQVGNAPIVVVDIHDYLSGIGLATLSSDPGLHSGPFQSTVGRPLNFLFNRTTDVETDTHYISWRVLCGGDTFIDQGPTVIICTINTVGDHIIQVEGTDEDGNTVVVSVTWTVTE